MKRQSIKTFVIPTFDTFSTFIVDTFLLKLYSFFRAIFAAASFTSSFSNNYFTSFLRFSHKLFNRNILEAPRACFQSVCSGFFELFIISLPKRGAIQAITSTRKISGFSRNINSCGKRIATFFASFKLAFLTNTNTISFINTHSNLFSILDLNGSRIAILPLIK